MMFLACFGDNVQAAVGRRVLLQEVRPERLLPVGQGRRVHDPARPVLQVALHRARRDDRPRGLVRRQGDRLLGADHQDQGAEPGARLLLRRGDALQHRPDRQAVPRRRHHRADRRRRRLRHARTWSRSPARPPSKVFFTTHALMDATAAPTGSRSSSRPTRPSTATIPRTPSRRSATTRSTCWPTRSSGPAAPIRRPSRRRSRRPRTSRASPARSPSRRAATSRRRA